MLKNLSDEKGSALITSLLIAVIITATLFTLLVLIAQQTRFTLQKENFLQAKYLAESGIYKSIAHLRDNWQTGTWQERTQQQLAVAFGDSVEVSQFPFGAYHYLEATSRVKNQSYRIRALVGQKPPGIFDYGLIMNPHYHALVVSGDARLHGDVLVGRSGVRKQPLRGRPYSGEQLVYGRITRTNIDQRPQIDPAYTDFIYNDFRTRPGLANAINFAELISDTSLTIQLPADEAAVLINTEDLNERPWKITGPGTLIAAGVLRIYNQVSFSGCITVKCKEGISLEHSGSYRNVLFYSPGQITLSGIDDFQGQLFSEMEITIKDSCRLAYPSIAMVYSSSDTGSVNIRSGSEFSGSIIYLTKDKPLIPTFKRGKVSMEKDAVVNGLILSDNLVSLFGKVNGMVVTDRFHFYESPTDYYNWIVDGRIYRNYLSDQFRLPLLVNLAEKTLTPIAMF